MEERKAYEDYSSVFCAVTAQCYEVNIGLCLVGVIIGEFIGARKGLGYLIIYSSQTFKLTWVLMSIIILCIIAIILYGLLGLIEKRARR